jgi:hypothetical protein
MKSLGMVDDKVGTVPERDSFTEKGFYLLVDAKVVKYWDCSLVDLYNPGLFRCYLVYILADIICQGSIIRVDTVESDIQYIAKDCRCPVHFSYEQTRRLNFLFYRCISRLPFPDKFPEFRI